MPTFYVSKKARDDIRAIGLYTQAEWGKEQRRLYLSVLDAQLHLLSENPNLVPERSEFDPPVRLFPYQRHLIVYLVEPSGILIVRILHRSMDIGSKLSWPYHSLSP